MIHCLPNEPVPPVIKIVLFGDISKKDVEEMIKKINITDLDKIDADYLVIHAFTPQTGLSEYIQNNQDKWQPINIFFFDEAQQQPALVVYQRR